MTELAAGSSEGLGEERRTSPLELLWDLVFVFAVMQVTPLLSANLTWSGFGQSIWCSLWSVGVVGVRLGGQYPGHQLAPRSCASPKRRVLPGRSPGSPNVKGR